MGAPYIYDISRLRVKDLHSATYIYVVRRLRVKNDDEEGIKDKEEQNILSFPSSSKKQV